MHLPNSLTLFHCSTIIALILFTGVFSINAGESVQCERVELFKRPDLQYVATKICYMHQTAIHSASFMITSEKDETIDGFDSRGNLQLAYVPANLGEKLPNLILLQASECAIKHLTKESFKGLGKLRNLWLFGNRIEEIDADLFENIPSIEVIILCKYAL